VKETTNKVIALEDLVSGKATAFASLHSMAMLSLITNQTAITTGNSPETLLFDVYRLSQIQNEFNGIVNGATILTIANHTIIGSDRQPADEKCVLMNDLASLLVASGSNFDFKSILDTFCQNMDSSHVLVDSVERDTFLKAVSTGISDKNDNVRKLM
jgi:hypothetical protein